MWPKMNYSKTAPKCWNVTSLCSSSFCICAAHRSAWSRDSIISMPDTPAGGNFLHRYFHFHFRNIETWSKQKIKIEWKQCYWCFSWFECRSPMFYYWVALKLKKYCVVLYCMSPNCWRSHQFKVLTASSLTVMWDRQTDMEGPKSSPRSPTHS